MTRDDCRKNFLDRTTISQIPVYAFPLGFELKQQDERPEYELLPMIFNSGASITYLQYLIFYESLDDYKKAFDLFEKVQEEMDRDDFKTEEDEQVGSSDSEEAGDD